ncbi:MAG: hypothetical protein RKO66_15430 [Candidatus Contendobacter sp.]|nr:hypothetical protein [Candidatus Contendobacter sp.]MDS4057253.1 hypothetical protein [Candidatus Contendobacter sp.]
MTIEPIVPVPPPRANPSLRRRIVLTVGGLLAAALLVGCAGAPKNKPADLTPPAGKLSEKARQEQRQAILKVRTQTLNQLYKLKPLTRSEIEQAAGYGVFEINGLNAVLAETPGRGVVQERKSGRIIYMRLARTDVHPGASVSPYWQVLVFSDPHRLGQFMATGSPADTSHDPSIKVYKLNEKGVSTQADWGARYFRDPDLN